MSEQQRSETRLLYTTYFVYFFCGLTMCFEGVFLPEFKEYFRLNYEQQMYTMFAKNIPFVLAVWIGYKVKSFGYKNCMTAAMLLFGAGTLALIPGLSSGQYWIVLLGFFLIGMGFNAEIVAGNPLLSALGPSGGSSSRLNLGNALGAVAQIIAPATLSFIIPVTVVTVEGKLPYMMWLFAALGGVLLLTATATALLGNVDISERFESAAIPKAKGKAAGTVWQHPKVILGFIAIFMVLGTEAALFSLFRNYVEDPSIAGLTSHQSQRLFTVYFAVFALGRLAASWMQKRIRPAAHVTVQLFVAMVCLVFIVFAKGTAALIAVTAIGFFVSIFFPTLYALAIEGMGDLTGQASGLLTMGFVGCAVIPVVQGRIADSIGLQYSYAIGFVPYALAAFYSIKGYKLVGASRAQSAGTAA